MTHVTNDYLVYVTCEVLFEACNDIFVAIYFLRIGHLRNYELARETATPPTRNAICYGQDGDEMNPSWAQS